MLKEAGACTWISWQALSLFRGYHLSSTTCLTLVSFKLGK